MAQTLSLSDPAFTAYATTVNIDRWVSFNNFDGSYLSTDYSGSRKYPRNTSLIDFRDSVKF